MQERAWKTEAELAALLIAKARANKRVTLTPETALFVGLNIRRKSRLPTREAIARLMCNARCAETCYMCIGKANEVVNAYGFALDAFIGPPDRDRA